MNRNDKYEKLNEKSAMISKSFVENTRVLGNEVDESLKKWHSDNRKEEDVK